MSDRLPTGWEWRGDAYVSHLMMGGRLGDRGSAGVVFHTSGNPDDPAAPWGLHWHSESGEPVKHNSGGRSSLLAAAIQRFLK